MIAPIVLFVYNRPIHTKRTIEALQKNQAAGKSELFIFSDGPENEKALKDVEDVRDIIRCINGFKNVVVTERKNNYGLARSIVEGVTEIVNRFGTVIVLEDDLITSPFFLQYMNDALDLYNDESRVMHISAGTYPIGDSIMNDTYFLRIPLCWGWGTWKRAWEKFEKNIEIMQQFNNRMISKFNFDGAYNYWEQLEFNRSGKLNTWFIFWYAKIFLSNDLVLFPKRSLVGNIGHDGSGVHCSKSNVYDVVLSPIPIKVSSIPLQESREAFYRHKQYFRSICPRRHLPMFHNILRIINKFKNI